jgi:hypothetical protein
MICSKANNTNDRYLMFDSMHIEHLNEFKTRTNIINASTITQWDIFPNEKKNIFT